MTHSADLTFIETQFPVSKLSKESYKERKANYSQTQTGLGKWWGRKPLIMVRAAILGLLLPASGDPKKDRETFLRILTMDEEGLWRRKSKAIPLREVYERLTPAERAAWFDPQMHPQMDADYADDGIECCQRKGRRYLFKSSPKHALCPYHSTIADTSHDRDVHERVSPV